jgi:hypothetical protein
LFASVKGQLVCRRHGPPEVACYSRRVTCSPAPEGNLFASAVGICWPVITDLSNGRTPQQVDGPRDLAVSTASPGSRPFSVDGLARQQAFQRRRPRPAAGLSASTALLSKVDKPQQDSSNTCQRVRKASRCRLHSSAKSTAAAAGILVSTILFANINDSSRRARETSQHHSHSSAATPVSEFERPPYQSYPSVASAADLSAGQRDLSASTTPPSGDKTPFNGFEIPLGVLLLGSSTDKPFSWSERLSASVTPLAAVATDLPDDPKGLSTSITPLSGDGSTYQRVRKASWRPLHTSTAAQWARPPAPTQLKASPQARHTSWHQSHSSKATSLGGFARYSGTNHTL